MVVYIQHFIVAVTKPLNSPPPPSLSIPLTVSDVFIFCNTVETCTSKPLNSPPLPLPSPPHSLSVMFVFSAILSKHALQNLSTPPSPPPSLSCFIDIF